MPEGVVEHLFDFRYALLAHGVFKRCAGHKQSGDVYP